MRVSIIISDNICENDKNIHNLNELGLWCAGAIIVKGQFVSIPRIVQGQYLLFIASEDIFINK